VQQHDQADRQLQHGRHHAILHQVEQSHAVGRLRGGKRARTSSVMLSCEYSCGPENELRDLRGRPIS